jgi:hypothetical protein
MTKPKMNISFSGGRTSAYMTRMLLTHRADDYDFIVTFANTGLEHPNTLEFIHNCDVRFGFNTVWLEAVVHPGERRACTHRVVTYETASRNGEPFTEVVKKYGIPNLIFQPCNRELKLNTMKSYRRSVGADGPEVLTAIGIRADERRRINVAASQMNIIYPLVNEFPVDKQDVLDWWEEQPFDLEIDEFEGNCRGCFKKSYAKHFRQIDRDPSAYDWHREMERLYKNVGPQDGPRYFFRGALSVDQLFELRREHAGSGRKIINIYDNGGCTESCEMLPTEDLPEWLQPKEAA